MADTVTAQRDQCSYCRCGCDCISSSSVGLGRVPWTI